MTKPAPHELSRIAFIATFGGIYEHSPWVAATLYDQGLSKDDGNPTTLAERMAAIVDAAGSERQMALLCAHPELAGKLAISGLLTAKSTAEQASAQLDHCSAELSLLHIIDHYRRTRPENSCLSCRVFASPIQSWCPSLNSITFE